MRTSKWIIITLLLTIASNTTHANGLAAFKAQDYDRAFRLWFMVLSENPRDNEANFGLGQIILEGLGTTDVNQKEGLSYLNTAIDAGSGPAALYLANAYREGKHVKENISKEIEYLTKAEKNGIKNLTARLGNLYKKRDGALSAQGCKTYSKNRNSDAYSIAQCIEKGFLSGRAADFYKVAFREGENDAYLKAGKYLLDPVSSDTDYDFMAQYMLAFLRKADKDEVNKFRTLITKNGITAEKCGIQANESQTTSRSRGDGNRDRDSSRSGARDDRSRDRNSRDSRDSRDRDNRLRDRDSRSSTRDRSDQNDRGSSRSVASAELNTSMCILAAEAGDPMAQVTVAQWFKTGDKGLALDQEYANQLLERGAKGDSRLAKKELLESFWADKEYEKRLSRIKEYFDESETENIAREALVHEAEELLEALKQDDWNSVPSELKNEADFIFGVVSLKLLRPDLRLILFEEELYGNTFGRLSRANAERIDLGSDDLFDAYLEFYVARDRYFQQIAETAIQKALQANNECELLAYINDNKRDFGEFGEDLVKDYGKNCAVKSPDEYIQIAEDYFKDREYRRGIDILEPLVAEENCKAIDLAVEFEKDSSELRNFVSDNRKLISVCNDKGDSKIDLAENRLEAAELFIKDEAFAKASDVLKLLLRENNCKGFELAVANRSKSSQLNQLTLDNLDLFERCATESYIVAVGYLETLLDDKNRQRVFDLAADYCTNKKVLGACPIATELLMDRENKLNEQSGKNQWSKPSLGDLRKTAIETYLLVAVEKNHVASSLALIKWVVFEKLAGTGLFKKEAEKAIDRLYASRNINGQALRLVDQLLVTNPIDIVNRIGNSFTGETKRRCTELKSYDGDPNLEPFVQEMVFKALTGQTCGIYN
jgi:TPR repeat protein